MKVMMFPLNNIQIIRDGNGRFVKGTTSYSKGKQVSDKTRQKISLANKGKPSWMKGKHVSEETRRKISKSLKDHTITDETIEKMRLAKIGYIPWNKGLHGVQVGWTKGKKLSNEHKRKIGLASKGRNHSMESRKKMSQIMKGRYVGMKRSDETKIKIRKARLRQIMPTKDTKPERMMQLALQLHGIKFRTHEPITGQPDIFIEPNICIFVDGCYFHGCMKCMTSEQLLDKIPQRAIMRDVDINHELNKRGYQVIRIWEHDIKSNTENCAERIITLIKNNILHV